MEEPPGALPELQWLSSQAVSAAPIGPNELWSSKLDPKGPTMGLNYAQLIVLDPRTHETVH